jgi:dolichol-phosphate mannosyltransferase
VNRPASGSAGPQPAVSVVLPTHNERANLELLVPQLAAALAGEAFELLIVDDASDDGSREWLAALQRRDGRVRALLGDSLRGIGDALRRGYDAARAEVIVSMDADLSFDAEVARQLLAAVRGGLDLVIGSRHHPGGRYEAPTPEIARKRLVSAGANRVLRSLVRVGVTDFSVDCRAIRRELWERLALRERTNIWLIEMVVESAAHGARIGEIPVRFRDRRFGASKLRLGREIFVTGWRVLWMIARYLAARLGLAAPRRRQPEST